MPPFRYAALIRCESKDQSLNTDFLQQHAQFLRQSSENTIDIWGPIPAPMERKAGRYQSHMVLLSTDRARLHFLFLALVAKYVASKAVQYETQLRTLTRKNSVKSMLILESATE